MARSKFSHLQHGSLYGVIERDGQLLFVIDGFAMLLAVQPELADAKPLGDIKTPNKRITRFGLYSLLFVADSGCVLLTFGAICRIFINDSNDYNALNVAWMVLPIYLIGAFYGNFYSLKTLTSPVTATVQTGTLIFMTMLAVLSVLFFSKADIGLSEWQFVSGFGLCAILLAANRRLLSRVALRVSGGSLTNDLLVLDGVQVSPPPGVPVIDAAQSMIQPDLDDPLMLDRLGPWLHNFDRVIVACPAARQTEWRLLLQGANIRGEIITENGSIVGVIGVSEFNGHLTLVVSNGPLNMINRLKKRLFDLALTAPALVLLSPLLILVAIAIKLDSSGPVFFLQDRVGRGNRLFKIIKFRSMQNDMTDRSGAVSASRDDARITRVGAFIRRTSIDELPQLINVLRGEMSLVGPRPHALGSTAGDKLFWEITHTYWCRHALKPGITGLAQIRGFRGATIHPSDLENRLRADLEYIRDWSFTREVVILIGTLRVVVHKNAY